MIQTMTTSQIANGLLGDFSYNGAMALAKYLEEYEDSTGEQIEFDPVAFRCDFSEYVDVIEAANDISGDDYTDEREARDYLESVGTLIEFEGGVIFSE